MAEKESKSEDKKGAGYELESINIRAVENGYVISLEKEMKSKGGRMSSEVGGYVKTSQRVADSADEAIKMVTDIIKGNDDDAKFDEAFSESDGDD